MSMPRSARTYNQDHVPRKYTPGKRRISIYWTWSYPWEAQRDPIIGAHDGTLAFKIPKRPIRKKIVGLPAFTTLRGGAYFFLPGIKALGHLASLNAQGGA